MRGFAERLLDWFELHGRHDLPWQREPTPYRVWVSEIMLQQTQVATVIPYYARFMAAFPSVPALARAPVDHVLKHWSGLGYYARARNLHRAAGRVVAEHGGELPDSLDALVALPGIGRSTASAILALAHGARHAILDGNVKRVLARHAAVAGWPGRPAVARELYGLAERLTPARRVRDYTQAIMDLGATVCTRSKPRCGECPVASDCAALRLGAVERYPAPRPKRVRPRREVTVLVVVDGNGRVLLERRAEHGVWGGLYSFPEHDGAGAVEQWCAERLGARPGPARALEPVAHAFTHFDLDLKPVAVELAGAPRAVMDRGDWLWYNPASDPDIGLAAPIAKLLRQFARDREVPA